MMGSSQIALFPFLLAALLIQSAISARTTVDSDALFVVGAPRAERVVFKISEDEFAHMRGFGMYVKESDGTKQGPLFFHEVCLDKNPSICFDSSGHRRWKIVGESNGHTVFELETQLKLPAAFQIFDSLADMRPRSIYNSYSESHDWVVIEPGTYEAHNDITHDFHTKEKDFYGAFFTGPNGELKGSAESGLSSAISQQPATQLAESGLSSASSSQQTATPLADWKPYWYHDDGRQTSYEEEKGEEWHKAWYDKVSKMYCYEEDMEVRDGALSCTNPEASPNMELLDSAESGLSSASASQQTATPLADWKPYWYHDDGQQTSYEEEQGEEWHKAWYDEVSKMHCYEEDMEGLDGGALSCTNPQA